MSKKRVSGSTSQSRALEDRGVLDPSLQPNKFLGLSLGGGKTDKTCLAVVDYFPKYNKIFLRHLEDKIKTDSAANSDDKLIELIQSFEAQTEMLAVDVPLQLPKCVTCKLKCPGYENCSQPEMTWLNKAHKQKLPKNKPDRGVTPYTERCSDFYVNHFLEEKFNVSHSLGSNLAPLTARAIFLKKRLSVPAIEVIPQISLWRIGRSLGISKAHLRAFDKSFEGGEARLAILEKLIEKDIAFIYAQDLRLMVEKPEPFDAFLCALTAILKFRGLVEKRPDGYPRAEAWIAIPEEEFTWKSLVR